MAEDHGSRVLRRLLDRCGAAVLHTHARLGDATASVRKEQLVDVMRTLRDDPELAFDMLTDLTCVDYLGQEPRFEMVYHLYSLARNQRLRVKARVSEQACEIDTLCPLWASANWMEREVWDLYGVRFSGHPDLRRILLYEEFQGHPLRKDYPKERRQPLVGPNN
jgi:NADH-quinone oxidoreductase subunit C